MLARPPDCTYRNGSMATGQPGRLHHAMNSGLPSKNCGIATCMNRAICMAELSSAGLWPCRPLHLPSPRKALPFRHRSYGLIRPTKILPLTSISLIQQVFAGCCEPLLEVGGSRRYLHNPCIGAGTLTPPRPSGALARFFPVGIGLTLEVTRSARENIPACDFTRGRFLGAAVIPSCSGSHAR